MYRPQFVYLDAPPNSKDVRTSYSFDQSNTPAFAGTIAAGAAFSSPIPLTLDQDADFFLRAIQIQATALQIGLADLNNHPLIDPSQSGFPGLLIPDFWSSTDGAGIVAMETDNWGMFCPAGSSLLAYVFNPGAVPLSGPVITLHGIKRYCGDRCK